MPAYLVLTCTHIYTHINDLIVFSMIYFCIHVMIIMKCNVRRYRTFQLFVQLLQNFLQNFYRIFKCNAFTFAVLVSGNCVFNHFSAYNLLFSNCLHVMPGATVKAFDVRYGLKFKLFNEICLQLTTNFEPSTYYGFTALSSPFVCQ